MVRKCNTVLRSAVYRVSNLYAGFKWLRFPNVSKEHDPNSSKPLRRCSRRCYRQATNCLHKGLKKAHVMHWHRYTRPNFLKCDNVSWVWHGDTKPIIIHPIDSRFCVSLVLCIRTIARPTGDRQEESKQRKCRNIPSTNESKRGIRERRNEGTNLPTDERTNEPTNRPTNELTN